jgi:hypothetical protein
MKSSNNFVVVFVDALVKDDGYIHASTAVVDVDVVVVAEVDTTFLDIYVYIYIFFFLFLFQIFKSVV